MKGVALMWENCNQIEDYIRWGRFQSNRVALVKCGTDRERTDRGDCTNIVRKGL